MKINLNTFASAVFQLLNLYNSLVTCCIMILAVRAADIIEV